MTNTVRESLQRLKTSREARLRLTAVLLLLSMLVSITVGWKMRLTGIALTANDTYCGLEEHKHDKSCYGKVLICDMDGEDDDNADLYKEENPASSTASAKKPASSSVSSVASSTVEVKKETSSSSASSTAEVKKETSSSSVSSTAEVKKETSPSSGSSTVSSSKETVSSSESKAASPESKTEPSSVASTAAKEETPSSVVSSKTETPSSVESKAEKPADSTTVKAADSAKPAESNASTTLDEENSAQVADLTEKTPAKTDESKATVKADKSEAATKPASSVSSSSSVSSASDDYEPVNNVLECNEEEHIHSIGKGCFTYEKVLTCTKDHEHTSDCYEYGYVLTCRETQHVHTAECYSGGVVPTGARIKTHIHTADCYKTMLVCGLNEHTHTVACYTDSDADVAEFADWEAKAPAQTGNWAKDLVAVAESQLGYTESVKNYKLGDDNKKHGYTGYGNWFAADGEFKYSDWSAIFAAWCLDQAGVTGMSTNVGAQAWAVRLNSDGLWHDTTDYTPKAGQLVFLDLDGDTKADHVGIISKVTDLELTAIVGDVKADEDDDADSVGTVSVMLSSSEVTGYASLPENPNDTADTADTTTEQSAAKQTTFSDDIWGEEDEDELSNAEILALFDEAMSDEEDEDGTAFIKLWNTYIADTSTSFSTYFFDEMSQETNENYSYYSEIMATAAVLGLVDADAAMNIPGNSGNQNRPGRNFTLTSIGSVSVEQGSSISVSVEASNTDNVSWRAVYGNNKISLTYSSGWQSDSTLTGSTNSNTATGTYTIQYRTSSYSSWTNTDGKITVTAPKDTYTVYVYVAAKDLDGNAMSAECLELLGIDSSTIDGNGYFPAGQIEISKSLINSKSGYNTEGSPLINSTSDWNAVLAALGNLDTSTLIDEGGVSYTLNKGNKVGEYISQAADDIGYSWGLQRTALFRWNGTNDYGFTDINTYHLDLRFTTNKITFLFGNNGLSNDDDEVDKRVYITGSIIQKPKDFSDEIPDNYNWDGKYYTDAACTHEWNGIGTALDSDQTVYIKLVENSKLFLNYQVATSCTNMGTVDVAQETIYVTAEIATGSTATANADYVFDGWYFDDACTQKVPESWVSGGKIVPQKPGLYNQTTGEWVNGTTYYAKFVANNVDVTITKVDALSPTTMLPGAVFTLQNNADKTYYTLTDGTVSWKTDADATNSYFTTGENGTITFTGLTAGNTYILTETSAPDGYNLATTTVTIEVKADGTVTAMYTGGSTIADDTADGWNFQVTNTTGYALPETGSITTTPYVLVGLSLMLTPLAILSTHKRKGGKEQ